MSDVVGPIPGCTGHHADDGCEYYYCTDILSHDYSSISNQHPQRSEYSPLSAM